MFCHTKYMAENPIQFAWERPKADQYGPYLPYKIHADDHPRGRREEVRPIGCPYSGSERDAPQ